MAVAETHASQLTLKEAKVRSCAPRRSADMQIGKSYINFIDDTAMPHTLPWHPRLSSKLGVFRLVQAPGGHEVCFTNATLAAEKILEAGRD